MERVERGEFLFMLLRILAILGCLPLAVLPGLCTCKAGIECHVAQQNHSQHGDSHESCCPAIEVENAVASVPAFQFEPAELVTIALTAVVEPLATHSEITRFIASPPIWPPGPPFYISHCSFII